MKKQEVRYFCDRCGEECTESVKNNGLSVFFVGVYEKVRERFGRSVHHFSGSVYLGLYTRDLKGEPITLCESCLTSLQTWFYGEGE
jgi:hypothetical protein